MRIHLLAMVALLTAIVVTGCDSAREVRNSSTHENAWGCDQCHGYPPPPFFPRVDGSTQLPEKTFPHAAVTGAMCSVCHPATVLADGHTINAEKSVQNADGTPVIAHRDGQVEAVPATTVACDTCHDTPPDAGEHLFHVSNLGLACARCHTGFDTQARTENADVHMQGLDYVVVDGGAHVAKQALADGSWPDSECAACHAALNAGGAG